MPSIPGVILCPSCGRSNPTGATSCPCGTVLGNPVEVPEATEILPAGISLRRLPTTLHRWLYLMAVVMLIAGVVIFGAAKSAVHEIEALICVLIAAVCFGAGAIVDVLQRGLALLVVCALTLVVAGGGLLGCGDDDDGCCVVCSQGKACGDSCIAATDTCRVGPGCACDR